MRRSVLLMFFICALSPGVSFAGGVQGRAAIGGEVREGVRIYVYTDFDTGLKSGYVKVSEPTGIDGTYKLELPAGRYLLVARLTKSGGVDLHEGDLYCYYSGSPVDITDSSYKLVGFNMIKVPAPLGNKKDSKPGVYGTIMFEGKPLEKVYLFAYKDTTKEFKGPAEYVAPSATGKFKLRLPDGEFYLIARKRKAGGMYGPLEKEDIFNYYYDNPVKIEKGVLKGIVIECVTRQDLLEAPLDDTEKRGITAHFIDETGKPLKGLYLLLYTDLEMSGRPRYVSERSDENGKIFVELNAPGKYYLIARSRLGGPAREGEYYSKLSMDDSSMILKEGDMHKEIKFTVLKFVPKDK